MARFDSEPERVKDEVVIEEKENEPIVDTQKMGIAHFLAEKNYGHGIAGMLLKIFSHAGAKTKSEWEEVVDERLNRRVW